MLNLQDAFKRAYKLTHRDSPRACYLGNEVPKEELIYKDPVKAAPENYQIQIMLLPDGNVGIEMAARGYLSTRRGELQRNGYPFI